MENTIKYNIIYADPPWDYGDKKSYELKKNGSRSVYGKRATGHYLTMKTEEICNLNISKLTDDNCVLFLWVTFPKIFEAEKIMKSWGFRYCTIGFNWIKTTKNKKIFFGVGYYTKSNSEICLIGMKGQLKPISNSISSIVHYLKQEHSRKPAIIREKIVELFGDLPRIELFARKKNYGWDSWGNEIISDINI